jgi:SAM-dependent methyltransferase
VVEIGAGTGFHSRRFADAGFDVLATDPSPAMVAHCMSLGLATRQADVLDLALDDPVDAAFAMNSLLHVPRRLLPQAFERICALLAPSGSVYVGIYGGNAEEGFREQDQYEPKRFFASHTDEELLAAASSTFTVVDFHTIDLGSDDLHFQSLTMERPA